MRITFNDAKKRYGEIINNKWADESKWMIVCPVPIYIKMLNSATNTSCTKIYINKDAKEPLLKAFENLKQHNLLNELKTFDGCFIIRQVRGIIDQISTHSYVLAIDLNAKENSLGAEPKLSKEFVKCFTDAGWSWGGNFKRKDGMHFSYAWE